MHVASRFQWYAGGGSGCGSLGHEKSIAVIRKGWDISWDMWDHRCSVRCLASSHTVQAEHDTLNATISELHQLGTADWRPSDLRWFRRTYPSLITETLEFKRQWISHVQVIRNRNLRRHTTETDLQHACFCRFFNAP